MAGMETNLSLSWFYYALFDEINVSSHVASLIPRCVINNVLQSIVYLSVCKVCAIHGEVKVLLERLIYGTATIKQLLLIMHTCIITASPAILCLKHKIILYFIIILTYITHKLLFCLFKQYANVAIYKLPMI